MKGVVFGVICQTTRNDLRSIFRLPAGQHHVPITIPIIQLLILETCRGHDGIQFYYSRCSTLCQDYEEEKIEFDCHFAVGYWVIINAIYVQF